MTVHRHLSAIKQLTIKYAHCLQVTSISVYLQGSAYTDNRKSVVTRASPIPVVFISWLFTAGTLVRPVPRLDVIWMDAVWT